jgi:4-hydroxybenzoate polyprenyltransferase
VGEQQVTARLRLFVLLARPSLVAALGLFALAGLAEGGRADDTVLAVRALAVVVGYLLCCVALNDLSDVAVDRINLPGDPHRPLATGTATSRDAVVVAVTGAVVALAGAAVTGVTAVAVVGVGLVLAAAYSLPPVRLAGRGAVASLVLPFGFVAVPFLTGLLGAGDHVTARDLGLLAGLYAGFVGRILLKDFRDVRGDALLGKRTFVVRHGRRVTCAVAAACWVAGLTTMLVVRRPTPEYAVAYVVQIVAAVLLLRALADDRGPRRDEAIISALAIVGRGIVLTLVLHLAARDALWPRAGYAAAMGGLVLVTLGQARTMVRYGPRSRGGVPAQWAPEPSVLG